MQKIKWLRIEFDCSHNAIIAAIRDHNFSNDRGWGFNLKARNTETIRATFVEKISNTEFITDPFGDTTKLETTRYSTINFTLLKNPADKEFSYLIEIPSPPRSIRSLIHILNEIVGEIFVSEVEIPLLDTFTGIKSQHSSARLVRIKASKLTISPDSIAKIEITSGTDAYSDFLKSFGNQSKNIEKIQISQPFNAMRHTLEVSQNGLIACDESHIEIARAYIVNNFLTRQKVE